MKFDLNTWHAMYTTVHTLARLPEAPARRAPVDEHTAFLRATGIDRILHGCSRYLSSTGHRMPAQDFPYNRDDKKTWKWIENPKYRDGDHVSMLNPNCIYEGI